MCAHTRPGPTPRRTPRWHRGLPLVCAALLLAVPARRGRAQQSAELTLEVGEQRVLPSEGVHSYSEGVPGVIDVRLTKEGTSFVIVGERAGHTSLLFMLDGGDELQYRITVTDPNARHAPPPQPDRVEARDNIRLDFYFVQLSEDGSLSAGVRWPAAIGGGQAGASIDLLSGVLTDATAAVTDQALPRLDLAQAQGWAKLLRQATLITANGTQAELAGGGELNLPVQSALSVGVRQIEFGSRIKVEPRYDREAARIELLIHAEVSDLSSDHGSGIPGRVTSSLDSVVNLELGQSLVLAGLTARSVGESHGGLPGLSQLPILGPLFGSEQSRSEHTENLIFIVPSVVDAVSLDARERVREALALFAGYEGALEDRPLRSAAPPPKATAAAPRAAHGTRRNARESTP